MRILLTVVFLSIFCFFACKSKLEEPKTILRPVYQPFQLGMSKNEAWQYLTKRQLLASVVNNRKATYPEHKTNDGSKYYSREMLVAPDADTMLLGLNIAYSMTGEDLQNAFSEGSPVMLMKPPVSHTSEEEIKDDIINELIKSYGKYDIADTINDPQLAKFIKYKWLNKNDVNITFEYRAEYNFYQGNPLDFYSMFLQYRYTDEMLEKISYKKSKY